MTEMREHRISRGIRFIVGATILCGLAGVAGKWWLMVVLILAWLELQPVAERRAKRRSAGPPPAAPCHILLGVAPDSPAPVIERAYRAKARRLHPDVGGDGAMMALLNAARDEALRMAANG